MAQIVPKLNLNKTPYLVEPNSLVFAKNIRLDVNGTIHRDYGVFPLSIAKGNNIPDLVNYKNILNRIISDVKFECDNNPTVEDYYVSAYNELCWISGDIHNVTYGQYDGEYRIVGIIPSSNEFYIFINGSYKLDSNGVTNTHIANIVICYDEKTDKFYPCNCNWNWSGGTIYGCVINNLIGEKILNIAESGVNLTPLKSINLATSSVNDDESIYTQVPNIPLTNLSYSCNFSCVIPNGVYQFFIRYRIRKDFYTNWFPASGEIFVGNSNNIITSFGTVRYTNIHRDSDNSFVLSVEHLIDKYKSSYDGYQIGFVLSHDDTIYARAWKHFDFNTTIINFDYRAEDAEEIELFDILRTTYGIYNVGNITTFKNKLYISNYTETNFNDSKLQEVADRIAIVLHKQEGGDSYAGNKLMTANIGGNDVISGLQVDDHNVPFTGSTGLFNRIITTRSISSSPSISEAIENALNNDPDSNNTSGTSPDLYWIRVRASIDSLDAAKQKVRDTYKNVTTSTMEKSHIIEFKNYDIDEILVNGVSTSKENVLPYIYNTPRYLTKKYCNWIDSFGELNDTVTINIIRKVTITRNTTYFGGAGGFQPINPTYAPGTGSDSDINRPDSGIDPNGESSTTETFETTYSQDIEIKYKAWENKYSDSSGVPLINNSTLVPYQKYKFYVHFVKSTGEVTNGYYCSKAGELEAPYMSNCNSVIYPSFSNINIPDGYVACFFSISHTKINTATLFNIADVSTTGQKVGSCIDINMMLIPANKNIHIKQVISKQQSSQDPIFPTNAPSIDPSEPSIGDTTKEVEVFDGKYYYSSDTSVPKYFGADGIVAFEPSEFVNDRLAYIVNDYSIPETENIELIKCTPYLNKENLYYENGAYSFDEYPKMNLLGFICCVTPLLRDVCMQYYSDGSSVFYKDVNENTFNLDELGKYSDSPGERSLANFSLKPSNDVYVYSNYNLNYVTLSEEPKMAVKTYYKRPANSTGVATEEEENNSGTILLRLIPSQLMSDIYILPSMYKSYTRRIYSTYSENETTRFDNTVRSSVLYGDENQVNVLTFDANDYYNIPTNRGIIVNIIAVGDAILVHTQDSMFKFSGSNTIQSSDGEILTSESKPFDTGVSEIFGSDFGFAGLQSKTDYIVTENGYIFFDRDSRIVYLYSGNNQITKVSESIEKLFRHKDISNVTFANDYYNNRFFVSIMFYEDYNVIENGNTVVKKRYYPVTLSFNTSEQVKSFVSLHDFYYHYAFNTKTKCYFLTADNKDICGVNKDYKGYYTKLELNNDQTYPQLKETITISAAKEDKLPAILSNYNVNSYDSIIDIIDNNGYETVKTLNAVNWTGSKIVAEFRNIDSSNIETLLVAEDVNFETPCKYIRVYSDTCMTPLNPCNRRSNDKGIADPQSYKYPRFNQGFWTFNYFRNILNSKGHTTTSNYMSDNNSLIEGKYFVTRFVFDTDFKFDSINLNYNSKI